MLLSFAKVEYTEESVSFEDWMTNPDIKNSVEFGQLPKLELDDGTVLSQSNAILRYLGKVHGYYPEDSELAWQVDSIIDAVYDLVQRAYCMNFESDEDIKKKNVLDYFSIHLPSWLEGMAKRISRSENNNFLVGDSLTIADFAYAGLLFSSVYANKNAKLASSIAPLMEKFEDITEYNNNLKLSFADYLAQRPERIY